jgi:hypothetical protein
VLRLACWIVLVASAVLFFISFWILIPAPHRYLVPLGVGSAELSPVLLAAALILSVLGALNAKRLAMARVGLLLALAAASLCWSLSPYVAVAFLKIGIRCMKVGIGTPTSGGGPCS